MQGSSRTSILLKWVRHSQFLRGNMFQFQGNLTWWTNTSSLVSFLQDNRKLKFMNKTHSKLKIQLFGIEPKCRSIITGFEHYSSTCSQLVPISLLCVEKKSAESLHEVQSTCWRLSKAHSSSLLHTPLPFISHEWRCLTTWQGPLTPSQECSVGAWLLQLLEAALEPHLHPLSLRVSLTWGTATPAAHDHDQHSWSTLSRNRKQLRSVSLRTQEHPSFSFHNCHEPQQPQLSTSFSHKFLFCSEDVQQNWLELHKPSPPLLEQGHPSSHPTNPPSLLLFHYCIQK